MATPDLIAARRKAASKLDDAYAGFIYDNGSDSWHNAYEYREDGYAIAEKAWLVPEEDGERENYVEAEIATCDDGSRYLIARAVEFRLAELACEPVKLGEAA